MNGAPLSLDLLRCPVTGSRLAQKGDRLECADGGHSYRIDANGIPLFAEQPGNEDASRQQAHYDRVAHQFLENLGYPHTQEYMRYLDDALLDAANALNLSTFAEICCGGGEACTLLHETIGAAVGVDISAAMLSAARRKNPGERFVFVQGDATRLPLESGCFDSVVMLGGIHHVNDRRALFAEIARILKPGGRFLFREPVSDLFLWRWLRAVVYRLSPALDADTERPLTYDETAGPLEAAGLRLARWRTYGFFGYCLLMNSDVLVANRLLRFLPGIRTITRLFCAIDDWTIQIPGMGRKGLIVIGVAEKPRSQ